MSDWKKLRDGLPSEPMIVDLLRESDGRIERCVYRMAPHKDGPRLRFVMSTGWVADYSGFTHWRPVTGDGSLGPIAAGEPKQNERPCVWGGCNGTGPTGGRCMAKGGAS